MQQTISCCTVGKVLQTRLGVLLCVRLLPCTVQNRDWIWKLGGCGLSVVFPSLLAFLGPSRRFMLVTLSSHCCSKGSGVNSWYMNWPSAPNCLEGALIWMLCGVFTLRYFFILFLRICKVSIAWAVHHCAIHDCLCLCVCVCIYLSLVCFLLLHVLI